MRRIGAPATRWWRCCPFSATPQRCLNELGCDFTNRMHDPSLQVEEDKLALLEEREDCEQDLYFMRSVPWNAVQRRRMQLEQQHRDQYRAAAAKSRRAADRLAANKRRASAEAGKGSKGKGSKSAQQPPRRCSCAAARRAAWRRGRAAALRTPC